MDEQEMRLGSVPELLRGLVDVIASRAWIALGLIPNPATRETQVDLDEARLAIDAAAALADLAAPRLSESERRDLQNLISTLRLNFVEQKTKAEQQATVEQRSQAQAHTEAPSTAAEPPSEVPKPQEANGDAE